jgi:hypothetical protein
MAVESAENRCPGQPMTPTDRAAGAFVGACRPFDAPTEGRHRVTNRLEIESAPTHGLVAGRGR